MAILFGTFGHDATRLINCQVLMEKSIVVLPDDFVKIYALGDGYADIIKGPEAVLLGKLFDRDNGIPIVNLAQGMLIDGLMRNFWGRYAGVFFNDLLRTRTLIRDPLGLSTIFYMPVKGGAIFSTRLSVLYDALIEKPQLDWFYMAEFIGERHPITTRTPFKGIFELMPGSVAHISTEGTIFEEFVWGLPKSMNWDSATYEEELFNALKLTMTAWTSGTRDIAVELSGGLDSSSVLCMLQYVSSKARIHAIHYDDTQNPSSSEIHYARQITKELGIDLTCIEYSAVPVLGSLPADWLPCKPNNFMSFYDAGTLVKAAAAGAAIFSGQGGDHVFVAPPPLESLADYWLDNGLRGSSRIMHELTSLYRTSWQDLIKKNMLALWIYLRGRHTDQKLEESALSPEIALEIGSKDYFCDNYLRSYGPGKTKHIQMLWNATVYAERDQRYQDIIVTHPLLSQPLVECALKIPTYETIQQGYNRYYLRKAISRITSSSVIWRRNKGHVTATVIKAMQAEFDELSSLINHGPVIASGIIDKNWVKEALVKLRHGDSTRLLRLLRIINVELWLRQWHL